MAKDFSENPYEYLTMDMSGEDEPSSSISVSAVESFYILPPVFKIYENSKRNTNATEALRRLYDYKLYESNVGSWIDVAYSIKNWVDPDYQNDYKKENKHFVSKYENVAIKLSAGKNADITIIKNSDFVNTPITIDGKPTKNGIYVQVNNKVYELSLDLDIAKVHDLVMVYNYALEHNDENLIKVCEQELVTLEQGKQKDVKFVATDYISHEEKDAIQQQCEYYAAQKALVENKIIPAETEEIKHPDNLNDLYRFADRVSALYQRELQSKTPNQKRINKICKIVADDIFLHPEEQYADIHDLKGLTGDDVLRFKYQDKLSYERCVWSKYEIESKHWTNEKGENYLIRLATGRSSYIDVCKGYQYDANKNEWVEKTGVYAVINNKRYKFPTSIKLEEVAHILRMYEAVMVEISQKPNNQLYKQYKAELDSILEKVSKGELTKFPYPKCHYDMYITKRKSEIEACARFLGLKTKLINEEKIPAETEKNKYKYKKNYQKTFRKIELKNKNDGIQYE